MRVVVSGQLARQIAVYTDQYSYVRILAPNGWLCRVSVYTDGEVLFEIYPPWENSPKYFWPGPNYAHASRREGVSMYESTACVGCDVQAACPYFAAARKDMKSFGGTSSCGLSRRVRVTRISTSLVSAVDPPGVAGTNWPSGGPYLAINDVAFVTSKQGISGTSIVTCTLPRRDGTLCFDTVRWFERVNRL